MSKAPPRIFDRQLYAQRRARAANSDGEPILVREIAEHMAERLAGFGKRFEKALDLSSRDESYRVLKPSAEAWVRTTPYPSCLEYTDEEKLPFPPQSFDLIVSVLALHAVNDLPGALIQIRRTLRPGGAFLGALFAGSTLAELRQCLAAVETELSGGAHPRVAPFADVRDLGALLQRAGFGGPVADIERTTVRYKDISRLVADLRRLGETNSLAARGTMPLTRRFVDAMRDYYVANYAVDGGRLKATFDVAYLTGWA